MFGILFAAAIPALLVLSTTTAWAQGQNFSLLPLSPVAIFNRCYRQLTSLALPANHPLIASVRAGSLSPGNACLQVLRSAALQPPGSESEGSLVNDTLQGRAVLSTLFRATKVWFVNDNLLQSLPVGECFGGTRLLHDETEPALHVLRTLLTADSRFSEAVTGDSAMEALRTNGAAASGTIKAFQTLSPNGEVVPLVAPYVQSGALIGIRKIALNPAKANIAGATALAPVPDQGLLFNRSLGGGILGTPSFMILNMGRPAYETANGGNALVRRLAREVFRSLLGKELPVLRPGDVGAFTQSSPPASVPFRGNPSCMGCHQAMDPFAMAFRNAFVTLTPTENCTGLATGQVGLMGVTQPREAGWRADDVNFSKRPPHGRLFFRSDRGDLINIEVNGIPALGQAIARVPDFYDNAAARYLQFFTGLSVSLQDPEDPSKLPLTDADNHYRGLVMKLGDRLKLSQSLPGLFADIWALPLYQTSAMRDPKP